MKKVISGKLLQEKMQEAIDLLCNTVKCTLGPKGNNVIIDHSAFSPFITNDGVTIAENISDEDEVINTILELAKEASIKTNENVGDGTTTTLVLLQSIFNNGLKAINEGISPIILKKELDNSLDEIIKIINERAKIPNKEQLKRIAIISSNDEEIGEIISEAYLQILDKSSINIKEHNENFCQVNYLRGYSFDSILPSIYFLNNEITRNIDNPYFLIVNDNLEDIEDLANIINKVLNDDKNIIIMAKDYSESFIQNVLEINSQKNFIVLLKIPEYGFRQREILEDLKSITKAKIIENSKNINFECLGLVNKVLISDEKVVLTYNFNDDVKKQIIKLNKSINNTKEEKEFIKKRITLLEKGSAEILVGAKTTTERREKKMRFDDALWAISTAVNGIIKGSGLLLSEIGEELEQNSYGSDILKKSLKEPMKQIILNAGLDYEEIFKKIKDNNYEVLYNINTNSYENVNMTKVIDSKDIVINSLSNAISIASMLLTTSSLVINENIKNLNKINDYNEI